MAARVVVWLPARDVLSMLAPRLRLDTVARGSLLRGGQRSGHHRNFKEQGCHLICKGLPKKASRCSTFGAAALVHKRRERRERSSQDSMGQHGTAALPAREAQSIMTSPAKLATKRPTTNAMVAHAPPSTTVSTPDWK